MNHERSREITTEMSGILDEEQPQTHEDREAQKLVERIEKKVSDQWKMDPKAPAKHAQQGSRSSETQSPSGQWPGTTHAVEV